MATKATIAAARKLLVSIAQKGAEMESLVDKLRELKGMDYHAYESVRADFVEAYCTARGADPKDKAANAAARKGWSRLMAALGIKKPKSETEAAARKRAARQAQKVDKADEGEPMAPAKATNVGQKIKMELVPAEAHLVHLVRRGAIAAAVDYLHKLAESAEA